MNTVRLFAVAALMLGVCSTGFANVEININNKSDKAISANLFKPLNDEFETNKPVWETGVKNLQAGGSAKLQKRIGAGTYKLDVCNSSNDFSSCNREKTIVVAGSQGKMVFTFDVTNDGIEEIE